MRFSPATISKLQETILSSYGIVLTEEEAQQIGLKITSFIKAKELNKHSVNVLTK